MIIYRYLCEIYDLYIYIESVLFLEIARKVEIDYFDLFDLSGVIIGPIEDHHIWSSLPRLKNERFLSILVRSI